MLELGRWKLASALDGFFALAGGAMFGILPRRLGEKHAVPDARHRIRLAARCLLAIDGSSRRRVLVDVGMGDKWDAKRVDMYAVDRTQGGLDDALARHGVARGDITDVVLTHLHFDHAGGLTHREPGGAIHVTFPNATFHLQRRNWQWALAPTERDRGSYL